MNTKPLRLVVALLLCAGFIHSQDEVGGSTEKARQLIEKGKQLGQESQQRKTALAGQTETALTVEQWRLIMGYQVSQKDLLSLERLRSRIIIMKFLKHFKEQSQDPLVKQFAEDLLASALRMTLGADGTSMERLVEFQKKLSDASLTIPYVLPNESEWTFPVKNTQYRWQ